MNGEAVSVPRWLVEVVIDSLEAAAFNVEASGKTPGALEILRSHIDALRAIAPTPSPASDHAVGAVATITLGGSVVATDGPALKALFDALPEPPFGVKSINVYSAATVTALQSELAEARAEAKRNSGLYRELVGRLQGASIVAGYTPTPDWQATIDWLRERAQQASRCEDALRELASSVGNGGYNAENVDASVFVAKVRDGIDTITRVEASRAAEAVLETARAEGLEDAAKEVEQQIAPFLDLRNEQVVRALRAALAAIRALTTSPGGR